MKSLASFAATLALASLAFAQQPPAPAQPQADPNASAVALTWSPAPGTKLERHVTIAHDLEVRSAAQFRGGNVVKSELSAQVRTTQSLAVVDELRAIENNRPTLLKRHWDEDLFRAEITPIDSGKRGKPSAFDATSALLNAGVVYTWLPAEQDWGKYYDEREELEEYLAELRQDLDFLALLPPRAVAPGDRWEVATPLLIDVIAPCGRVERRWPKELDTHFARTLSSGIGGGLSEVFGAESHGGGRVTLVGVEGAKGARKARLAVELDIALAREQDPSTSRRGAADDAKISGPRVKIDWGYQAKGELVWLVDAGRAESFELSGQQRITARFFADATTTPAEEMVLGGTLSIRASIATKP